MNLTTVSSEHRALILVGPTAVGKTALSLDLAQKLNGEIVSADSRQIYKFMDIGTAKPTLDERSAAPHHFVDILTPNQNYSAGEYGRAGRSLIKQVLARGKTPIVVGGSGFYIQALIDGLFAPKISDPDVKKYWHGRIRELGIDAVFEKLQLVDPETAARLHQNDHQRIVRALEVWQLSGKPISSFRKGQEAAADFQYLLVGLNRERTSLYDRIERRVDAMLKAGLIEEVKHLQSLGFDMHLNALRTVGYQEVFEYFDGTLNYQEMCDKIKMNTRRYAKRQLTWFRRDSRINWLDLDSESTTVREKILHFLNN